MVDIGTQSAINRIVVGDGTSEFEWNSWSTLRGFPEVRLEECARVVVVSPHPDDETLGLGGTIATFLALGTPAVVVTVTDGEASHPLSTTVSLDEMRRLRHAESLRAMKQLSAHLPGALHDVRMQVPDGQVTEHEGTLTDRLCRLLQPGDWCFATWEFDGHPDHEAAGRAARAACDIIGARCLQYPIWTWNWASPRDSRPPWERAGRISLTRDVQLRKRTALDEYRSQLLPLGVGPGDEAVVPPHDLDHFTRPFEVVFT